MQATMTMIPDMPAAEYFALPGLSYSGLKDLAISPLRYWYRWINPDRPEREETPEMRFGSALHCAVLEPDKFLDRYACAIQPADFEGCLETMDDLRAFLREHGVTPRGTRKEDVITQVLGVAPEANIYDVLKRRHVAEHAGKVILPREDWDRVYRAAEALRSEPKLQPILAKGQAEVSLLARDPETGTPLKCRIDWLSPVCTLDIKTFSQKRDKPIDKTITDAIWYEGYHLQAYFYSFIRTLQRGDHSLSGPQQAPPYVLAFVESEEPHEVRLRSIRPRAGGDASLLWTRARSDVRNLIDSYAQCVARFCERPWRTSQDINQLVDEEFPALVY